MPSPSQSLATLRPDLAGSVMEFDLAMDRMGFIANRVAPVIEVAKASGSFGRIPIEQLLQQRSTERAPGGAYSRGNWKFEPMSYACQEHGAEEPVDDREAEMYAEYFDAEAISAARALDAVVRNYEARIAAEIFNPTTYAGASLTTAVTHEWDDATNAVPITDIEAAVRTMWENTGAWANALIINRHVFRNLRNCDQVIERIQSNGAGSSTKATEVTTQQLAEVFDLPYILVAGSAKNTADKGQSASIAPLWSDEYAMVCRIAETNDIKEPCIMRTLHYGADGSTIGGAMETYRDETVRSNIVRCRMDTDEKVIYTQMGHLLSNITT